MKTQAKISLEQWSVFCAVVDEGSYASAAEYLNKSQSSVSYTLSKMQERLPAPALILQGRKAELTPLGSVLYRQAKVLLEQAHSIDQSAERLAQGWEAEITIAADALTPMPKLFCALQAFSEPCPTTRVRILETTLSGTDEALLERRADLAIMGRVPPGFLSETLCEVSMRPIVAATHALAQREDEISERELMQNRQIVIRDSGLKREQEAGWLAAEQRWTVSHFSSSIEAVKAGLGFAFLPIHCIEKELQEGSLVVPNLSIRSERKVSLNVVLADQSQAGPGVRLLLEKMKARF